MSDKKKLNSEELTQLQEYNRKIQNLIFQIGNIETQKQELITAYNSVNDDLQLFTDKIRTKYGDVQVDIQTGEVETKINEQQ